MRYQLIPLFALGLCIACQETPAPIYLSGSITDAAGDKVILYRSAHRTGYKQWIRALDTTTVDPDGAFSFTYITDAADYYQVVGSRGFPLLRDVYLAPGDSLEVTKLEEPDPRRFVYAGANAGAYACYDLLDSLMRNDTIYRFGYFEIARMAADSARAVISDRTAKKLAIVDACFAARPDWDLLAQRCRDEIIYRSARERYDYLYYHKYYTQDTFVYLLPDAGFYDFLDDIDLTYAPPAYLFEYQHFLDAFLRDRVFMDYRDDGDSTIYANMLPYQVATAQKYLSGVPRDLAFLAIADNFAQHLRRDDFFVQLDAIDQFLAANHTSATAYEGFRAMKAEFEKLRPGNPAPELALPDANGDTVRLSDQQGKVVYLDFWGTWCFPCLQEMPHSLTLQEKYAGQPVEFIYVGLQSGEDQLTEWREFIRGERSFVYAPFLEQRVYPGTHLLAEGQFGNPAIQPYKIGAAPTYVLIGGDGRIISANAPRPGSEEIVELIDAALVSGD